MGTPATAFKILVGACSILSPIILVQFSLETPILYKFALKSLGIEGSSLTQKEFSHLIFGAKWTQRLYFTLSLQTGLLWVCSIKLKLLMNLPFPFLF